MRILLISVLWLIVSSIALADEERIILQSTTSTQHSGLYEFLLPLIKADTGVSVHVVAVGTGQAINNAKNCDGDLLLVHSINDEMQFVDNGYGLYRENLMYNDYVLIGSNADEASVGQSKTIDEALSQIANNEAIFVSRGDDSGTHKAEIMLWQRIDIDPTALTNYREAGAGMGATLSIAIEMDAYTIADRSTWIAFGNKQNHHIVFEGDPPLFNQYGIIPVSPDKCPDTHLTSSIKVAEWLLSDKGQDSIAKYFRHGNQLFFPNAR
ncbi:MAG TPA: sulfate transporter [Alphaproteobacteria bacterium]|nr:sulfate transporter [Alphaproteobacteria bacterium]